MEDKEELKPIDTNVVIETTLVFYEETDKKDTIGSNDVIYEVLYISKTGIAEVYQVGAFGDRTLVGLFRDRRKRGIALNEMLENIQELSNMSLKEFKKILKLGE